MTTLGADAARRHLPVTLGIDLGTSSSKAVVVDVDGRVVAQASADYPVHAPHQGWAETDPDDWWAAVTGCVREAVGAGGVQPAAIGLSGQMHGLVLADAARCTGAAGHCCGPTAGQSSMVAKYRALDSPQRTRLANPLVPGMAGPMLAWVAEHEPDSYARARWALAAQGLAARPPHRCGRSRAQ